MDTVSALLPVIGSIIAAAITAVIALMISILTKEYKISEFRHSWIEDLRMDVADLLGGFNILEMELDVYIAKISDVDSRNDAIDEFIVKNRVEYARLDSLCNRIMLRLNPVEHADLLSKLRDLERSVAQGHDRAQSMCSDLVKDFAVVLKTEWGRVKQGELAFRAVKKWSLRVGFFMFLLLVIITFFYVLTKPEQDLTRTSQNYDEMSHKNEITEPAGPVSLEARAQGLDR